MNLITPLALSLGLLLPVIVTFYLLKLRRTEKPVSSTYLWRRLVRDVEANAPWQRLKPNLLLFLQLLFLILIIFALARPFVWANGLASQTVILILDSSASMGATDVKPSRLEAAKNRARQIVNEIPENGRVTVIEAGKEAKLWVTSTQDRRQAHLAIDEIFQSTASADLGTALELASAVASRQPDTEIVVLSDGLVSLPERLMLRGRLNYIPVGQSAENQSISQLNLEKSSGLGLQAFIQVNNYGQQAVQRRLNIYADGALANVLPVDLPAGGSKSVLAADLPATAAIIEARLEGSDSLAADDQAWALVRHTQPVKIALVSTGNLFLRTALQLLPNVELTEVSPDSPLGDTSYAAIFYDNTLPAALPPAGALFFIAPPKGNELFQVQGLAESPNLRAIDPEDPFLRDVNLSQIHLLDSVSLALPAWATTAIAGDTPTGSVPLLFYGESAGRRIGVLAFDLRHSDLPLQVAFPVLLANTINWLSPQNGGLLPSELKPGAPLPLELPANVSAVTITQPDGRSTQVKTPQGRGVYTGTQQLGVYSVSWEDAPPQTFVINLFSSEESAIKPADTLKNVVANSSDAAAGTEKGVREFWRPLAALALLILVIEGLVYQRAALRQIWDHLFSRKNTAGLVSKKQR